MEHQRNVTAGGKVQRKLKVAFVAGEVVPPVCDGSTYVYKNWIDALAETCELYAILFDTYGVDTGDAQRYLADRCTAHLILPGPPRARSWKLLRAMSRFAKGTLFAAPWIEELGRSRSHRIIADFIDRHAPELFLVSKLSCVPLLGRHNIVDAGATLVLDIHDDFILRDALERTVLRQLLTEFPGMKAYPPFHRIRLRQKLTRMESRRARAQEAGLYKLFNCVLSSSVEECTAYRSRLGGVAVEFLGWPARRREPAQPDARSCSEPSFDAGFIGGDHPFNVEAVIHFCRDVLPLIRRERPDFRLLVAGYVSAPLARAGLSWAEVEFASYVPDPNAFYDRVRICVAPVLSGTGVSLKTLEAIEYGKPIVATPLGARGLQLGPDQPTLALADKPEDFARAVLGLLARQEENAATRSPRSASLPLGPAPDELLRSLERLHAQAAAARGHSAQRGDRPAGSQAHCRHVAAASPTRHEAGAARAAAMRR